MTLVTLYGRPGCHLCEEARVGLLALMAERSDFELRDVDIETDPALHRRMLELIPIVEVEGAQVCELFLDVNAVSARLDTLSG